MFRPATTPPPYGTAHVPGPSGATRESLDAWEARCRAVQSAPRTENTGDPETNRIIARMHEAALERSLIAQARDRGAAMAERLFPMRADHRETVAAVLARDTCIPGFDPCADASFRAGAGY